MRLIFKKEKNSNNINKTELIYLCLRNTIINLKKEDNFNNNGNDKNNKDNNRYNSDNKKKNNKDNDQMQFDLNILTNNDI